MVMVMSWEKSLVLGACLAFRSSVVAFKVPSSSRFFSLSCRAREPGLENDEIPKRLNPNLDLLGLAKNMRQRESDIIAPFIKKEDPVIVAAYHESVKVITDSIKVLAFKSNSKRNNF